MDSHLHVVQANESLETLGETTFASSQQDVAYEAKRALEDFLEGNPAPANQIELLEGNVAL